MKKRFLSIILTIAMLISGISIYASAENKNYSIGDINGDGKISAADARLALRVSANLDPKTDHIMIYADINKDGKVTASDARIILRISANLENIDCYINAQGHNYIYVNTVAPTCETSGYDNYKCSVCNATKKENTVSALNHNYQLIDSKAPSCSNDGYEKYVCKNCNNSYETILNSTNHSFSEWKKDNNKKTRSCTKCGFTETENIEHKTDITYSYVDENGKTITTTTTINSEVEIWAPTKTGKSILNYICQYWGWENSFTDNEGDLVWVEGYDATGKNIVLYLTRTNNTIDLGYDKEGRRYNPDGKLFGYCPTCKKPAGFGENNCDETRMLFEHWGGAIG